MREQDCGQRERPGCEGVFAEVVVRSMMAPDRDRNGEVEHAELSPG